MNVFVEKPSRYGAQIFEKGIPKFWTESSKRALQDLAHRNTSAVKFGVPMILCAQTKATAACGFL